MRRRSQFGGTRVGVIAGVVLLTVWALAVPEAQTYESYHDPNFDDQGYCAACHPAFGGGPDDELHQHHTGDPDPITANCELCHTGSGRDNPLTMWSIGGENFGCAGCHGRLYGETIDADYRGFPTAGLPKASGFGLRAHHRTAGIFECQFCHEIVDQDEILPESVNPPNFARDDVHLGGLPADGCTNDATGNDPDVVGLDNDGDFFYDLDDRDCQIGPIVEITGECPGRLTIALREVTPGGSVALLAAVVAGSSPVPDGMCEGVELGLVDPRLLTVTRADESGELVLERTAPVAVCGRGFEALDLSTCQGSEIVPIPSANRAAH